MIMKILVHIFGLSVSLAENDIIFNNSKTMRTTANVIYYAAYS